MAARSTTARKTTTASASTRKRVVRKPAKTEELSHEIHAYIPDPEIAHKYVGRQINGVWDKTIADIAIAEKRNILLMGPTGSGKTLFGEAYAAATGRMYYSLPCDVSIDPTALFGRMQPTEVAGRFEFVYGPVSQIVKYGGVLNISEINFMMPKIAASIYPLLDGRRYIPLLGHRGEVVRAHEDLLIIADMNPNYRGTIELNAAFKNRFGFKIPWDYDTTVEEKLVKYPTLREIASQLREMHGTDITTPVSTNMLMEFESFVANSALSYEFAAANFASAFETDEQEAVTKVFELNKTKLESEIAFFARPKRRKVKDDDVEEIDWEFSVD